MSPASFRHFGLAYGHGIVGNLRRRPWLALALPLFLVSYARAARQAARSADLVHAHWLPSALPAIATRRPFVVQLWGTDAELAGRFRFVARRLLRRGRLVLCPSEALAEVARGLGALNVRVVPSGVDVPERVAEPVEPPHVLFVGRLSEEKGVAELLEATAGLEWSSSGMGRCGTVPGAVGFVPPGELGPYYERRRSSPARRGARATVSSRGRRWRTVARSSPRAVGGLLDAVDDGVTGLLVPPRDPAALRAALERLLDDPALRRRLGDAARERARERFSWDAATQATVSAYHDALGVGARGRVRSCTCRSSSSTASGSATTRPTSSPRSATTTRGRVEKAKAALHEAKACGARRGQAPEARQPDPLYGRALRRPVRQREQLRRDLRRAPRGARVRPPSARAARAHAREIVTFFATAFDIRAPTSSPSSDMPAFKIASADLVNTPLLRHVAALGKPIILSTGRRDARRRAARGRDDRRQPAARAPPVHGRLPGAVGGARPRA